jgi:hypothetical protein
MYDDKEQEFSEMPYEVLLFVSCLLHLIGACFYFRQAEVSVKI